MERGICVFELHNSQKDYALCLEFIKTIISGKLSEKEKKERLTACLNNGLIVYTGVLPNPNISARYFEQPFFKINPADKMLYQ